MIDIEQYSDRSFITQLFHKCFDMIPQFVFINKKLHKKV